MPAYKDKAKGTWYASFYYENWTGKKEKKMKRGVNGGGAVPVKKVPERRRNFLPAQFTIGKHPGFV